jgi:hypothetical protein
LAAEPEAAPLAAVASTEPVADNSKTTTIKVGDKDEAKAKSNRWGWWNRGGGD